MRALPLSEWGLWLPGGQVLKASWQQINAGLPDDSIPELGFCLGDEGGQAAGGVGSKEPCGDTRHLSSLLGPPTRSSFGQLELLRARCRGPSVRLLTRKNLQPNVPPGCRAQVRPGETSPCKGQAGAVSRGRYRNNCSWVPGGPQPGVTTAA